MLRSQKFIEKVKAQNNFFFSKIFHIKLRKNETRQIFLTNLFIMEMNGAHQTSANQKLHTQADTFHSLQLIIIVIVIIRSSTSL